VVLPTLQAAASTSSGPSFPTGFIATYSGPDDAAGAYETMGNFTLFGSISPNLGCDVSSSGICGFAVTDATGTWHSPDICGADMSGNLTADPSTLNGSADLEPDLASPTGYSGRINFNVWSANYSCPGGALVSQEFVASDTPREPFTIGSQQSIWPSDGGGTFTIAWTGSSDCVPATSSAISFAQASPLQVAISGSISPVPARHFNNDGTYFSIPWAGGSNHFPRYFTVNFAATQGGLDVTDRILVPKATVEIDDAATGAVLEQAFETTSVQIVGCGVAQVPVTFSNGTNAAVAPIDPPPAKLTYKIALTARDPASGEEATSPAAASSAMHALWHMPDQFDACRYSTRDAGVGGDDWVSANTFRWMETNAGLLTAINDISGEHGYNLGHATHGTGSDIDEFHPAAREVLGDSGCNGNGGTFYRRIAAAAETALTAGPGGARDAARRTIREFIRGTRANIDALMAVREPNPVRQILYMSGCDIYDPAALTPQDATLPDHSQSWDAPFISARNKRCFVPANSPNAQPPVLNAGWAWTLLTTGNYTNAAQQSVFRGQGEGGWNPDRRVRARVDHNDHLHITLRQVP
jgi:hypothetical protein